MIIKYRTRTKNNGTTVAGSYHVALLMWFSRRCSTPDIPAEPGIITLVRYDIKYPTDGQQFIDIVVAACEREFGKTPYIDDDYMDDEDRYKSIIYWLKEYGDIIDYVEQEN